MRYFRAVVLCIVVNIQVLVAQERETGFLDRTLVAEGVAHHYQVYVPRTYDESTTWPVILFLHGAGERGADGLIQTEVGLGEAVRRFPERYPAIVVFPQAPEDSLWQGTSAEMAMAVLDETIREYRIDVTRIYLTGLSMGGNGSWYLGYHHADRFAAVVPICAWVGASGFLPPTFPDVPDPHGAVAVRLGGTPVWIFHGESDGVVPVDESRAMFEALQTAGGQVKYTELPGIGHNSWDAAYASQAFATWLFQQRRQ